MLANTFDEVDDAYSIADAASMTLQDGDWNVGIWTRVDDNSGTLFQYLISNGTLAAVNTFNMFLSEDTEAVNPDKWAVSTTDGDGTATGTIRPATATGADSKWRLLIFQRNTGAAAGQEFELWFCEEGQPATLEATASDAGFNAVNGSTWYIARRADGNVDRYYGGHAAWFFKGDFAWTQTEIDAMGDGLPPFTAAKLAGQTLDVCIKLHESAATLPDITGNGNTATRIGAPVVAAFEPLVCSPVKRRRLDDG